MNTILAIIPAHNRVNTTLNCISQLQTQCPDGALLHVLVIDDGSNDGTYVELSHLFPDVYVHRGDGNLWWAGCINVGLQHAVKNNYDYAYLCNDDNVFHEHALRDLYDCILRGPRRICTSVCVSTLTGRVLDAGHSFCGFFRLIRANFRGALPDAFAGDLSVDVVGGRSTLLPLSYVHDAGLLSEKRFPQHYSDFEYFSRAKAHGYTTYVVASSRVGTEENPDYFHGFLQRKTFKEVLKAYSHIKYSFCCKTIFHRSFVGNGTVRGIFLLCRDLLINSTWLVLKLILPSGLLNKLIRRLYPEL